MISLEDGMVAAIHSIFAKIAVITELVEVIPTPEFASAILTIEGVSGKIIVSGMGKSGHIGRKLVATFQSTGQRAAFLHPAEAAHGDMGIISQNDCLLLLSNSGKTDELIEVARFGRDRFDMPILSITAHGDSPIARLSTYCIAYPDMREGDPLNLAPMASTTAQLTIGDALAAALMKRRSFTPQDFARLHHGGYLGSQIANET